MTTQVNDYAPFIARRAALVEEIKKQYPDLSGSVALFADFEQDCAFFQQENSFYYFTGIEEPAVALVMNLNGESYLFVPSYPSSREKFCGQSPVASEYATRFGVTKITPLGEQCSQLAFGPFFSRQEYENLIKTVLAEVGQGKIFTLCPNDSLSYRQQRFVLERLGRFVPSLSENLVDISSIVAQMRRKKGQLDLEYMFKAIEVSALAQEAAAQAIVPDATETEVQAAAEYIFTGSGLQLAYPSVVAGGKNATVLHGSPQRVPLKKGDLVVVDIGAKYGYYCADLTRTYPVSGKFTEEQKKLYDLVLAAQEYIAELVKPGYWLSNKEQPDKSLTHLARAYFDEHGGYGKYFIHGLGHFLGMDAHDVGDYTKPLQEGDVITIEPGIYIPEKGIGIRIEDNYWITKDGCICLSDGLPKKSKEVEEMVQQSFE